MTLLSFYAAGIAEAGDTAIKAAVSAIELGLQVTNLVLGLGLPKTEVKARNVRAALKRGGPAFATLLRELDSLFDSIGWKLLLAYRHWVTHRGAPVALVQGARLPIEIPVPVPLVDAPRPDESHSKSLVEAVNLHVLDGLEVVCWPFVPPSHGILDDEHGTPGIQAVGIALAPDSNMKLTQNRVSVGNLREDAESYRAKNPVLLGRGSIGRADEHLERYAARDYIHAVHEVARAASFAEAVLSAFRPLQ